MKANNSKKSYALIDVLELPYLLKGLEEGRLDQNGIFLSFPPVATSG